MKKMVVFFPNITVATILNHHKDWKKLNIKLEKKKNKKKTGGQIFKKSVFLRTTSFFLVSTI